MYVVLESIYLSFDCDMFRTYRSKWIFGNKKSYFVYEVSNAKYAIVLKTFIENQSNKGNMKC